MSGSLAPNVFEIGNERYSSTKMNAFQQFHVVRKLAPLLSKVGPVFLMNLPGMPQPDVEGEQQKVAFAIEDLAMISPILEALSAMNEADCEYVLHRCLSVTKRWQEAAKSWAPVWNDQAKRLVFEDIDLMAMMQITAIVLRDNLMSFSSGLPQNTSAPPAPVQRGQSNSSPLPTVRIS